MNVYAQVGFNHQQVGGDLPEGWIVMEGPRPDDENRSLYTAQADGTWAITQETLDRLGEERESAWVAEEMRVTADQLLMLEDGDPTALPGTDRQWRDYRIALRAWKTGAAGYPDPTQRPVRPA